MFKYLKGCKVILGFNFDSLESLMVKAGFEVVHKESTFPIGMFLLMGDYRLKRERLKKRKI
jgi:hypothetical protein